MVKGSNPEVMWDLFSPWPEPGVLWAQWEALTGSYPELEVLNPVCGMTYVISILSVNVRVYLLRHQCTVRQCACVLTSSVHCPSMCVCTYYVISVLFVNVRVYLLRHQCTVRQCACVLTTSSVHCPSMCVCTYYVISALSGNMRVYLL